MGPATTSPALAHGSGAAAWGSSWRSEHGGDRVVSRGRRAARVWRPRRGRSRVRAARSFRACPHRAPGSRAMVGYETRHNAWNSQNGTCREPVARADQKPSSCSPPAATTTRLTPWFRATRRRPPTATAWRVQEPLTSAQRVPYQPRRDPASGDAISHRAPTRRGRVRSLPTPAPRRRSRSRR